LLTASGRHQPPAWRERTEHEDTPRCRGGPGRCLSQQRTDNSPLGYGWRLLAGVAGAGLPREKIHSVKKSLPRGPTSRCLLLQTSPKKYQKGSLERTSDIFPHRTRHAANKMSFPSPSSRALKPAFSVKDTLKAIPSQRVLCAYVEFSQAEKCSAVTGPI